MKIHAVPVALVAAALAAAPALAQEPPEFAAATELVQIDAVVLDRDGRPVPGLTAGDFVVEENGEQQRIVSFDTIVLQSSDTPAREPEVSAPRPFQRDEGRYLVLFIDDHHLNQASVAWMRAAVGRFLVERLGPSDRVTLIAPKSGLYWTSRSAQEHRWLAEALARVRVENHEAFGTDIGPSIERQRSFTDGPTSHLPTPVEAKEVERIAMEGTLDGVLDVLRRLSNVPGRKSLILYSQALMARNDKGGPGPTRFDAVIDLARRSNVAIEYVDARGLRPRARPGYDNSLAWETGGRVTVSNDGAQALETVLRESSAYYLLGYEPPAEGRRKVKVRVLRPGLEVRARNRYFVGTDPGAAAEAALPTETRALRSLSDATRIDFVVRTLFSESPGTGPTATTLLLEIRPPEEPRERRLRLLAEALPLAEAPPVHDSAELGIPPTDQPVRVSRAWELSPGVWQARIVLADVETGELGPLSHTFEVPDSQP